MGSMLARAFVVRRQEQKLATLSAIRAWQADIPCELATIDGKLDAEFAISKL
jgi:hypothetical protein